MIREQVVNLYYSKAPVYQNLADEAKYIIEQFIGGSGIQVHFVRERVKSLESLLDKIKKKEVQEQAPIDDPFKVITDIVGVRIVCLFLSDIQRLGSLISEHFSVIYESDKLKETESKSFGYFSYHIICKIKDEYIGPRYNSIKDIPLEIQIRTIAMDAWAATSHYLQYKSEADIPSELKRDFYAMSGLFYVADTHFEMFFKQSKESQADANSNVMKAVMADSVDPQRGEIMNPATALARLEINFDNVSAYLRNKFSDRRHTDDDESISLVVGEIWRAGYRNLGEVDKDVESAFDAFIHYEMANPPGEEFPTNDFDGKFLDIGALRITLDIANDRYVITNSRKNTSKYDEYRHLVKR